MNSNEIEKDRQKKLFFNIVIFILIIFTAIRVPLDTDFWWHLRAGQLSIANGSPVMQDLTTFSVSGSNWVNHSWLSQIIYFLIQNYLGNIGVMISVAIFGTLTIFFVFIRLKSNPIINGFTVLLCVLATAVVWSPRPQLLTLLFFAILTYLLYEYSVFEKKIPTYLIPILFLVWGNLHAGFTIGVILLVSILIGKILDFFIGNDKSNPERNKILIRWFLLIVVCVLIVMINPNGIGIWQVQFNTLSIPSLQNLIPEWASPNFHELYQQPFLWIWLLLAFFFMANKSDYSFATIVPLVLLGGLGFLSRRNYVYFAVFSIPILSNELQRFYEIYIKKVLSESGLFEKLMKFNQESNTKVSKFINLFFVGLLLFLLLGKIVYLGSPIIYDAYESANFPKSAMLTLEKYDLSEAQCLNSYTWGGYLSWKNPDLKIFIDGRTDLFGEKIIQDWIEMVNGGDNWEEKFAYYGINCVFLENERPIIGILEENSWKVLFSDDQSIILTNPGNELFGLGE